MPNENQSIPKYVVLEKSLIGNDLYEAGATVEYDGLPSENLQPTCDVGRARYQEYLQSNADRIARMKGQYAESAVGDPAKFALDLARANAEMMASIPSMIATAVAQAMATAFPNGIGAPAAPAAAGEPAAPATEATTAAAKSAAKAKTAAAEKPAGEGEGLV